MRHWLFVALCLSGLTGQLDAAESNLREGERLGVFPGMAAYRLAQIHAKRGQGDKAIAEMERDPLSAMWCCSKTIRSATGDGWVRTAFFSTSIE